jgi:hypothetical protein
MAKMNYGKSAKQRTLSTQASIRNDISHGNFTPTLRRKVMRFGKYKNYEYRDLPMDYLKWAILNLNDDHLIEALVRELQRRDSSFIL